ncbi:hypothetical protein JCM6882_005076 [Rhodosporidiobolus microsporus]
MDDLGEKSAHGSQFSSSQLASTGSPSAQERQDRLSSLPSEILREIFQLAGKPVGPPLSKRLLPFHLEQLYRSIQIRPKHSRKADILLSTVLAHSELAQLVRKLDLSSPFVSEAAAAYDDYLEEAKPQELNTLHTLLLLLRNLEHLTLHGSFALAQPVLEHAVDPLVRLRHLELCGVFGHRNGLDPSFYRQLHLYPLLSSLSIFGLGCGVSLVAASPPPPIFRRLTELRIDPERFSLAPLEAALRTCANLNTLELVNEHSTADYHFFTALSLLPQPHLLRNLSLINGDAPPATSQPLSRFTNLTHLRLAGRGRAFPLRGADFFATLRGLPLYHLSLDIDDGISQPLLLDFLHSPPPSLAVFTLSGTCTFVGKQTDPDDEEDVFLDEEGAALLPPRWVLPIWCEGWSSEAVLQVRGAAEAAGVHFQGEALAAVEMEQLWRDEVEKVERYNAAREAAMEGEEEEED